MKKYSYILLTILLFMIFPITMKALVCSNSEKVEYQNIAKNISTSYEYVEENGNAYFIATFSNMNEKVYLKDANSGQTYYDPNEITIYNLQQGQKYKYLVYSNTGNCDYNSVYTIYLNLPYYNPYYTDSLCKGIEDYKFCQKFVNKKISYEEFQENVTKYIDRIEIESELKQTEDNNYGLLKIIADFYLKYYYIILPIIIISCIVTIKVYNKKDDLF